MVEIKSRWKSVADRENWAARGASFVAKAKATKVVWFPPKSVETGKKKAVSTTKRATKKASKKTTGATKRTTGATKRVTNPVRRKKA